MNDKIAIFSDIHGNEQALIAILSDIKKKKINRIYCLGDTISIGPNSKECMDLIINNDIKMIIGNHELYYIKGTNIDKNIKQGGVLHNKWVSNQLGNNYVNYLNNCPLEITETFGKYKLKFQHFIFKDNYNKMSYPYEQIIKIKSGSKEEIDNMINKIDADIIFIGHEHSAFTIKTNTKKLIDVGSSGCTKNDHTFYTIISLKNDKLNINKVDLIYDRKSFEQDFKNKLYPDKKMIGKAFFGIGN